MSITFRQISLLRRKRTHGFRQRMKTPGGRLVLKRRKAKGRSRLTVQLFFVMSVAKKTIIKRSSEIRAILQTGKHTKTTFFKIAYTPSLRSQSRWAILVGKRYGKAVKRNRIKRWLREILRMIVPKLKAKLDFLIMPRATSGKITYQLLQEKVILCFKKEGLL